MAKKKMRSLSARSTAVHAGRLQAAEGLLQDLSIDRVITNAIVQEILDQMNITLQGAGKAFTPTALDEWVPKLRTSVKARLLNGGNWANERAAVLVVASDMARIGSILSATSPKVNKGHAHASFRAVKEHNICPGSLGSGRWCDFDI